MLPDERCCCAWKGPAAHVLHWSLDLVACNKLPPCAFSDPTSFSELGPRETSLVDVCGLDCTHGVDPAFAARVTALLE